MVRLGTSRLWWDSLVAELDKRFGPVEQEWKRYSRKAGWTLVVRASEKTLVYLTPAKEALTATVVLGEAAVATVLLGGFSAEIVRDVASAKQYVEGRPVRVAVRNRADVKAVADLVACKLSNQRTRARRKGAG